MKPTHPEMVAGLVKPGADILATLDPSKIDLLHMAIGIAGEAGEIVECACNAEVASLRPLDEDNMIEELGDIEFYLEGFRQVLDIDRKGTVEYPEEFEYFGHDTPTYTRFDAAMLLMVQTTKLLDLVKKIVIYNKAIPVEDFIPILTFVERWLFTLRRASGITREETLSANIAKLSVRYAGLTYSDQAAQTRADKAPGE